MPKDNELYNEFKKLDLDITFEKFVEIIDRFCNIEHGNLVSLDKLETAINKINNNGNILREELNVL